MYVRKPPLQKNGFSFGIGASIRISQEILYLPNADVKNIYIILTKAFLCYTFTFYLPMANVIGVETKVFE